MAKFARRDQIIEAYQWFKNGDHPEDGNGGEGKVVRYFRHPEIPSTDLCPDCRRSIFKHGWIDQGGDGEMVCPGDWIVTDQRTRLHEAFPPDFMERAYLEIK